MGILKNISSGSGRKKLLRLPRVFFLVVVLASMLVFGGATGGLAIQKHTLDPNESSGSGAAPSVQQAQPSQQPAAPAPEKAPAPKAEPGHAPAPAPAPAHPQAEPAPGGQHAAVPGTPEHGAGGEEHGVQLPEISPIAGVTFVDTVIRLMDHELHGRTLGWRPNDLIIGRFTDNINNYQLGVLEAIRFTSLRLKDSLTRMGDADTYDPDLEQAVNLFMNSATLWWFPSAESSYSAAIEHLKKFRTKLEKGQRSFYYRRDNLVALLTTYRDLLGNVNRSLIMPSSWYHADEAFYYAKGVAHVYYEILKVCRVGFKNQLSQTMHGVEIMDEILHELHTAENIEPWIVFNAQPSGFLANHRANLNAPLSEVAHLLMVLGQL